VTPVRLIEIVAALGGELLGDGDVAVTRIAALDSAEPDAIAFLANPRYATQLAGSRAACVIVAPGLRAEAARRGNALIVDDPYLYYARLTQWWRRRAASQSVPGIHASAVVEAGARIAADASIGALAFVGAGAAIGAGAVIGAQAHVAADAAIGERTRIAPQAVIGAGCRIGARGIVHGGAVIGAED
jgi:UDP-3-O-[3-hydroxymyristoyl] glucosamine N-acyltransferase